MSGPHWSIVIPSLCRPTLSALLDSLAAAEAGPTALPAQVVVVDDRRASDETDVDTGRWRGTWLAERMIIERSYGRGPARARNVGWRRIESDWVVFLDDDVELTASWIKDAVADIGSAPADVVAVQGRITVPLPSDRRPNDAERNTAGLETASWITADMAVRLSALRRVGGFDERFPRAFREDADLALRLQAGGGRLLVGERRTVHPARAGNWALSVRQQRGNADDVLMTRLHGRDWYERANAARGRRPMHLATVGAGVLALVAGPSHRRGLAAAGAGCWAALTASFAWARIAPGPRDRGEIGRMIATSALIPPAAVWHWLRAIVRVPRHPTPWPGEASLGSTYAALLVDRDGTLIVDVPYNGDPNDVQPMPGVAEALSRARAAGLRVGVVSNQSGIARGLLDRGQVDAVNRRVEQLLGPFDTWQVCPHGEADGCDCRKPRPGLVDAAAHALGVAVERCLVIGDIGADVGAAEAAGTTAVLVPTPATRPAEIDAAAHVAADFAAAVDAVLAGRLPGPRTVPAEAVA